MYPHIEPSLSKDITNLDEWMKMTVSQNTVDEAKSLAMETLNANYKGNVPVNVVTRRELIALKDLNLDTPIQYHEGRTKVLFSPEIPDDLMVKRIKTEFTYNPTNGQQIINVEEIDMPPRSHETAITFAQEKIVRIDSVFLSPKAQKVVDVFREGLMNGYIKAPYYYDQMILGTFFEPNEWRFQFSAYSWESDDFITTSEPYCEDSWTPYGTGLFPFCADDPALMDFFSFFRLTDNYRKDYWYHWNLYGRTNGIRGNCKVLQWPSQTCVDWEIDNWVIKHHNLGEYEWVCPSDSPQSCVRSDLIWPNCCYFDPWPFCEDWETEYSAGGGYILEDIFYNDLEDTHVALLYAHGGPAYGISHYQIQSQRDIWAYIHTVGLDGLGKGKLRHLFLASCASMNWHKEEPAYLETDWLNNHVADGIRSIFGTDGGYAGTYIDGLIFFSFYNNGDSISDSWANMEITITPDNVPVGIGYGSNPFAALASLLDDRFSKTRAGNNVAAVLTLVP